MRDGWLTRPACGVWPEWSELIKRESAQGGCLGTDRRRRTWQAAKSLGELQASVDPGMSEWGNPLGVISKHRKEPTQGTETSKYLEEKKSIEIPKVAASEMGLAQTWVGRLTWGLWGYIKVSGSITERYWNVRP